MHNVGSTTLLHPVFNNLEQSFLVVLINYSTLLRNDKELLHVTPMKLTIPSLQSVIIYLLQVFMFVVGPVHEDCNK